MFKCCTWKDWMHLNFKWIKKIMQSLIRSRYIHDILLFTSFSLTVATPIILFVWKETNYAYSSPNEPLTWCFLKSELKFFMTGIYRHPLLHVLVFAEKKFCISMPHVEIVVQSKVVSNSELTEPKFNCITDQTQNHVVYKLSNPILLSLPNITIEIH